MPIKPTVSLARLTSALMAARSAAQRLVRSWAMGRLRYYLAACLILILTHSASAVVTDALSQAGFTCLAASDSSGAPFGGTMCTHEAMSTAAFTLDEPVAVYVPSTTSVVVRHIVLYLQGFRGVCGDIGTTPLT